MNKNIFVLLLGSGSLLGCYSPTETEADGSRVLYIPAECKEIVSLTHESHTGWNLTCKDDNGGEVFYQKNTYLDQAEAWDKYKIVRK